MKLLAAADIHGSQYRLNLILKNIEIYQPDIVVICGDITQYGPGSVATNFLNQIPVETLAVPGNIDTAEVGEAIRNSNAVNINLEKIIRNNTSFIGVGALIPDPFYINDNGKQKLIKQVLDTNSILVSHIPPFKIQDKVFIGHHAGSKELREVIDLCQPRLMLCGHIHEDPGFTTIDSTTVVNCSLGKRTEGAFIEISDTKTKVTIIE